MPEGRQRLSCRLGRDLSPVTVPSQATIRLTSSSDSVLILDKSGAGGKLGSDLARLHTKLAEAQFFLGKMIEQERRAFGDRQPFDYYLSAFLNAGMSVRGGFQYRQNPTRNKAIKAWRKQWETNLSPEDNTLYEFMRKDRVDEVHAAGSSRSVGQKDIRVGVGDSYSDESGTVEVWGSPSVLLGVDTAAVIHKPIYNFTIDGTERKVTEACDAYLALLRQMVAQCVADDP
jgi:hypothetical protein